jgi:hypothetical protein
MFIRKRVEFIEDEHKDGTLVGGQLCSRQHGQLEAREEK